jgi:VanZ family protein
VQHALAYGVLTTLMALGWPKTRLLILIVVAIMFGIGMEVAQGLGGQGRLPSAYDAVANGVGAMIAASVFHVFRK